jgi:hypothetical protein
MRWLIALLVPVATSGAQQTTALQADWELPTPRQLPQSIAVDAAGRQLLHVALKSGGYMAVDVTSEPENVRARGRVNTRQLNGLDAMHLAVRGDTVYLALGDLFSARGARAGLAIIVTDDPDRPRVLGVWQSTTVLHGAAAVVVRDGVAYLGAMTAGVITLDVRDPANIREIARFQPDPEFPRPRPSRIQHPNARGLALQGNLLVVAYDAGGLRLVDVSDPARPREVGRYLNPALKARQQAYNSVALRGDTAFVAVDYAGMEILAIGDVGAVEQIGWWNPWNAQSPSNTWFNSPAHTNQIEVHDGRAYLSAGDGELFVIDVSAAATPRLVGQLGRTKDGLGTWGMTVQGKRGYATYITAIVPFRGTWAGLKGVPLR